jgi:hypothetical protein
MKNPFKREKPPSQIELDNKNKEIKLLKDELVYEERRYKLLSWEMSVQKKEEWRSFYE